MEPAATGDEGNTPRESWANDEAIALAMHQEESSNRATTHDAELAASLELEGFTEVETRRSTILDGLMRTLTRACGTMNRTIPLIPRTNARSEAAPPELFRTEKHNLMERLRTAGLEELIMEGDGNCQYRALSDQLYRTPVHHAFVRSQVLKELRQHSERYTNYVLETFDAYLKKMERDGTWGDHVTLQAAANAYGCQISIVSSFAADGGSGIIEINPVEKKTSRMLWLSFFAEVHYNSLYPAADLPLQPAANPDPRPVRQIAGARQAVVRPAAGLPSGFGR